MSYTLAEAAAATGIEQSILLKAIKNGKIRGVKDAAGEWRIEPAELHAVYPALPQTDDGAPVQYTGPDVEELGAQIEELLRQAALRLRQQIDERERQHTAATDK